MLSTSELLSAAKSGRGIPSNYRLARVMGLSDQTIFRWHSGAGSPDDAHAAELAVMAGLDVEYVVMAMRTQREKDPTLRAIWARTAERLLMTSAHGSDLPPAPPSSEGGGPDSGDIDDGTGDASGCALMSMDESHIMRSPIGGTVTRRQARIALARALRALRKARSH